MALSGAAARHRSSWREWSTTSELKQLSAKIVGVLDLMVVCVSLDGLSFWLEGWGKGLVVFIKILSNNYVSRRHRIETQN